MKFGFRITAKRGAANGFRVSTSVSQLCQGAQRESFRRRLPSEKRFRNSMFFIAELGIKKRVVNKNGNYWSGTVEARVCLRWKM